MNSRRLSRENLLAPYNLADCTNHPLKFLLLITSKRTVKAQMLPPHSCKNYRSVEAGSINIIRCKPGGHRCVDLMRPYMLHDDTPPEHYRLLISGLVRLTRLPACVRELRPIDQPRSCGEQLCCSCTGKVVQDFRLSKRGPSAACQLLNHPPPRADVVADNIHRRALNHISTP
eukprot:scaffold167504_cov18-Prasinocladus_malaysianus.AAC.1